MTKACILPFPPARRQRFVTKQAARMACLSPEAAERHLVHQLQIQADTMARRGIEPEDIQREVKALDCAIRTRLWRIILSPEGAA